MEIYKNFGGNSNARAYEIENDSIKVQFGDGSVHLYTYQSAGRNNIEHMKTMVVTGRGLNSFIMRHIRKAYAAKLV
jgi:hypothetical protein